MISFFSDEHLGQKSKSIVACYGTETYSKEDTLYSFIIEITTDWLQKRRYEIYHFINFLLKSPQKLYKKFNFLLKKFLNISTKTSNLFKFVLKKRVATLFIFLIWVRGDLWQKCFFRWFSLGQKLLIF